MDKLNYDPCDYCAFCDACPSAHFWPFGYKECAFMSDMRKEKKDGGLHRQECSD